MIKINWNKIIEKRGKASTLQVLIMVISIFAFAFILASAGEIEVVSAGEDEKCCLEMNNGAVCQDINSDDCDEKCNGDCQPSSCDEISSCEIGCCFDLEKGLCMNNVPKKECVAGGGKWGDNPSCAMPECVKSCCILGNSAQFVTEKRCEVLSDFYGYKFNFQEAVSEIECLMKADEQDEGACILGIDSQTDKNSCLFTTKAECIKLTGENSNFKKGWLCSHPDLDTGCEKQKTTGCAEGKDEVYWFDSCGNRENIYDSNKERSWNDGKVLEKDHSCLPGSKTGNANSISCGNCNYKVGSMCGQVRVGKDKNPNYGDYICQDLSCEDDEGNKRLNGESWCEYESYIGEGKDVPGSRHVKKYCQDGKIITEPCSDYRNGVCAEGEVEDEAGNKRSVAICKYNAWRNCLLQNNNLTLLEKEPEICTDIEDCELKNYYIDEYFNFTVCTPKYPAGFDWKSEDEDINGNSVCSLGNQTCTVVYVKKGIPPKWVCEANCECEDNILFTQEMNDFCMSLGDCGASVNIVEEITDEGYAVKNAPRLDEDYLKDLKNYAEPVEGQKVDVRGYGEVFEEWFLNYEGEAKYSSFEILGGLEPFNIAGILTRASMNIINFWVAWILIEIIIKILGLGKVKKVQVQFTCMPWMPPDGGDDCELCHGELADNGIPCTKYRCQSLGKACEILNEGTGKELCVAKDTGDKSPPDIEPYEISKGYEFIDEKSSSVKIREGDRDRDCVQEFQEVKFSLETSEPAQCKFSFNSTATYDEMIEFFDDNMFKTIHNRSIIFPSVDALEYYELNNSYGYMDREGNLDAYVRCKDFNGNWDLKEYKINFCVRRGPDLRDPYIVGAQPKDGSYLAYGTTLAEDVVFNINEPATCKYSKQDLAFDLMENTMDCAVNFDDYGFYGGECLADLEGLTENNKFYVKCKDQPWLPEDNESRNTMDSSYVYNIKVSKEELEIDYIEPEGEIFGNQTPFTIELISETIGGAKNGDAVCKYSFTGYKSMVEFLETGTDLHKQIFNRLTKGKYSIYVKCEDEAKNTAEGVTEFNLELDAEAPIITKYYYDSGLKFITNEKAICGYSTDEDIECGFSLDGENTSIVDSDYIKEHNSAWDSSSTYYIKCKDKYGNRNIDCGAIVHPYDVLVE